jgi:hypothetical protein
LLGAAGREPWGTAQGSGRSPGRGGPRGRAARAPWSTAPRGRGVATGGQPAHRGEGHDADLWPRPAITGAVAEPEGRLTPCPRSRMAC